MSRAMSMTSATTAEAVGKEPAFGNHKVSLKSVIQTRRYKERAEIVAVTHVVKHRKMQEAAADLEKLAVVSEIRSIIRVENPQEDGAC
ncbi:hypothetical protein HMPREF1153_1575 [Selenomonas sp. CM52]|nr:hypothetical protein HMPREF1153_1575 [Selenomonas sp. CM52]